MTDPAADVDRHALRDLLRLPGFRRLLAVRYPSQAADGAFQFGAAFLLLFTLSPTEATSAGQIALVIAVTTLPFTLIGPFAGVLIDRWRRQRILVWTNLVRVGVVIVGLLLAGAPGGQAVFLVATLLALSINRLLLATLGAVTPKVVPGAELVPANAIASIGGTLSSLLGAVVAAGLAELIGEDSGGPQAVVVLSVLLYLTSVFWAARIPADALGPDLVTPPPALRRSLRRSAQELIDGVRRIAGARRAWAPIVMMSALRGLSGIVSIAVLLVYRNIYGAGPGEIGVVLVVFGIGAGLGAAGMPVIERRLGMRPETALRLALGLGGAAALVLAPGLARSALLVMHVVSGIAFSMAKIATDTLVQSALPDRYRGRVFAAYDILYNGGFLVGALVAAAFLPDATRAEDLLIGVGIVGVITALLARRWLGRMPPPVDVETWEQAVHAIDPAP
ncbi:MAG TPA: MFS transporter [Nitriliruptorales bacterium]